MLPTRSESRPSQDDAACASESPEASSWAAKKVTTRKDGRTLKQSELQGLLSNLGICWDMVPYPSVPYFQTKPTWSICNSIFRPGKTVWNRIWMCCCQALHHIVPMCSPRQVDKMIFPKSMEVGSQEGSQSGAMCCGTCHRIFVIERLFALNTKSRTT